MKKHLLTGTLLATGAAFLLPADRAHAQSSVCGTADLDTVAEITDCVTLDALTAHLQAFQDIADANGGNRASGLPGYDASVAYLQEQLEAVGYEVELQLFPFTAFLNLGASELIAKAAPDPIFYEEDVDFAVMSQTDPGRGSGRVQAVDLDLGIGNESTSGCEPEDFEGFKAGRIALVQRGACTFQLKAENAAEAGADGIIIFNQGNSGDRRGLINGTLGAEYVGGIPAFFTSYELGVEFSRDEDLRLRMTADVFRNQSDTANVIADLPGDNPDNIVVVGAHLDSVDSGPGISDNATGSAGVLETAIQMAGGTYPNTVRFAWWGAEESGLIGAQYYVDQLSEEDIEQTALYLNFDMIGSPNFVHGIYDGDDSDLFGEGPGPEGSAQIEATFEAYFDSQGIPYRGTDFSGRSDYGPFIAVDIPAGGLFTGADGIKTEEEAEIWGGTAGEIYDPCYHTPCDTIDNVSFEALDINADALAAVTLNYALSTQDVNGVGGPGLFVVAGAGDGGLALPAGSGGFEMLGELYAK